MIFQLPGGLLERIPETKKVICDRVYSNLNNRADEEKLALPNMMDDQQTANFKARARYRHESFNGRLVTFKIMQDTFHRGQQ